MSSQPIDHDAAAMQFSTSADGHRAVLDYRREDGAMVITHTGVPEAIGGRGIASQLTHAAFEHAKAQGWKVRPACAYAAAWAGRHPEYNQLLG